MTLAEIFSALAGISGVLFVITSMLAMGMSLTMAQILQPLKNTRLVVLPLLLTGVEVNPWDIAQSLIVLMLIPLAIGLLIKSHSPDSAAHWQPFMNKISFRRSRESGNPAKSSSSGLPPARERGFSDFSRIHQNWVFCKSSG